MFRITYDIQATPNFVIVVVCFVLCFSFLESVYCCYYWIKEKSSKKNAESRQVENYFSLAFFLRKHSLLFLKVSVFLLHFGR